MKLTEALQIVSRRREGMPFQVLLACGFTPLHFATAVNAHLCLALPDRSITIQTGLYGDLAGTIEAAHDRLDTALVALEWGDLDPRLAWRSIGSVNEEIISDAQARMRRIRKGLEALAEKSPVVLSLPTLPLAPVFSSPGGALNRIEARLWEMLYQLVASSPVTVLHPDISRRFRGHDLRAELLSGFPYSFAHAEALAAAMVYMALPPTLKKGLITDLDETLWSGVLGDDGPDALSWDLDHKEWFHGIYQQVLNLLGDAGILLGVASKNDPELVQKALARRDLVVKPQILFPIEAHFRSKTESVRRILGVWNIGEDAVVFVDDNPLELEQVKAEFPKMECLEFRKNDANFLVDLRDRFGKRDIKEEDKIRVSSLRAGEMVRNAAANTETLDTLLAGAKARINVRWTKDWADPRPLELINKTNQFKLNSKRYTGPEWRAYLSKAETRLMVVEYEDRFGKLGKIAVLTGREQKGGFDVENWVMSCRAFSRRIEHQCIELLLSLWEPVRLQWECTQRNAPMRAFLAEVTSDFRTIRRAAFRNQCPPLYHKVECTDD